MRPVPGRQWTSISKTVSEVLKVIPGLSKENMGQRWVGTCTWAVKVKSIPGVESIMAKDGLAGSGQAKLLGGGERGWVSVPIMGRLRPQIGSSV